jgi:hypothetical protein
MTIAPKTLSNLQAAGAALNVAAQSLQQELQAHSQALMEQMALQPFGAEADGSYQQMRQVARLAHEINSLEQQLKAIYQEAAQFAQAEISVLPALPSASRSRRIRRNTESLAPEIAEVEDVKTIEATAPKLKEARKTSARKTFSSTAKSAKPSNPERLLKALQKILKGKAKAVSQVELAQASGLPRGSIGASIKKLQETQKLAIDADGFYRLA